SAPGWTETFDLPKGAGGLPPTAGPRAEGAAKKPTPTGEPCTFPSPEDELKTSRIRQDDFPAALGWLFCLTLLLTLAPVLARGAPATGKLQGKVTAADSNEPIGFADVLLVPADTALHKVGGLTNADGTFLLEAPAGRYTLQIRAISYAKKTIEGIVIQPGGLTPFQTSLAS